MVTSWRRYGYMVSDHRLTTIDHRIDHIMKTDSDNDDISKGCDAISGGGGEVDRPPLQCRVMSESYYNDGSIVTDSHILTWMGEIQRRADPEKDDQWKLCAPSRKYVWTEVGDIQILGRTPGSHYLKEWLDNGGNPFAI